ncbi:MAG: class I SAM-dependent methyltransferase [Candidatus Hermodarchaeota archaeon]
MFYDERYEEIQNEKYKYFLKESEINRKKIFDAGCGSGLLIAKFYRIIKSSTTNRFLYVGIDISLNMLKLAKSLIKTCERSGKYQLIHADLENLPIRGDVFQSIFSITSLQNLYDIKKGLFEINRTAKNGADLNISILKKQLDRSQFITILESYSLISMVEEPKNIEDLFIKGRIIKKDKRKLLIK